MKGSSSQPQPVEQHAYLVRLWRPNSDSAWRVIVKTGGLRYEHHLTSVDELIPLLLALANADR